MLTEKTLHKCFVEIKIAFYKSKNEKCCNGQ